MSWSSLIFVIMMGVFALALLLKKHWPRKDDGSPMSPEEMEEFMDKFPKSTTGPDEGSVKLVILIIVSIAMLAIAVTRAHGNSPL